MFYDKWRNFLTLTSLSNKKAIVKYERAITESDITKANSKSKFQFIHMS